MADNHDQHQHQEDEDRRDDAGDDVDHALAVQEGLERKSTGNIFHGRISRDQLFGDNSGERLCYKDSHHVGNLATIADLVEGYDGVVEDFIGPRNADRAPLRLTLGFGDRHKAAVHRDPLLPVVVLTQSSFGRETAHLVAKSLSTVVVVSRRSPL